jgi:hypothetical protein
MIDPLTGFSNQHRVRGWIGECAPWMNDDDRADDLVKKVATRRYRFSADKLAKWLNVTYAERQKLGLRTIGAFDIPKEQRTTLRRERYHQRKRVKDREWHDRQRRQQGKPTRSEWLKANSASRKRPWLAAGFSRRTWYRRRGTGCS